MNKPSLAILGTPDFNRRMLSSACASQCNGVQCASLLEGWSTIVSSRPDIIVIEIGLYHSERQHRSLRHFLQQLRERFSTNVYIIIALTAAEQMAFGGDLLFAQSDSLAPSSFVDMFLVAPPGDMPSLPSLSDQLNDAVEGASMEFQRRKQGKVATPALNSHSWVQSMADNASRDLWLRWLPRYASYTNENPLIYGETGTGKTNLAFALHLLSGRKGKFVSITPRDFSSSELVQAELFGAVPGAYTGAVEKWGLVKSAEGGTLFIDELQSIDKDLQGKIITFIESKAYRRVGSAETITADVRFVFAANRTLPEMMSLQILRDDFAYRLERVRLDLLPLSSRRLDIGAALAFALAKIRRQRPQAVVVDGISSAAYRLLFSYRWPGNLRQLENTVAQLCELCDVSGTSLVSEQTVMRIFATRLSSSMSSGPEILFEAAQRVAKAALTTPYHSLEQCVESLVEQTRLSAIESCAGDARKAAELIGENSSALQLFQQGRCAARDLSSKN